MKTQRQTSKEYFRMQSLLHYALWAGQFFFLGVAAIIIHTQRTDADREMDGESGSLNLMIALIVTFGGLFLSRQLFRNQVAIIKQKTNLKQKLTAYRIALLKKYALIEGPTLLAIVLYIITENPLLAVLAGLVILLFFLERPTRSRLVNDLDLTKEEQAVLEDPEAIVTE